MTERQVLVERKVGLFKMSAFWEDGRLLSQRPSSQFLEQSRSFIGIQEAEKGKEGISYTIYLEERLLGSGLFRDGYLQPGLRHD